MNDALANGINNFVLIIQDVENLLTIMEQQNKDFEHALEDDKNQIASVKEEKCMLEKVGRKVNVAVQGVPIENCQTEIALVLKLCMSDPML